MAFIPAPPLSRILQALANNDTAFALQVMQNSAPINTPFFGTPSPLNLTGYTLKVYTKTSNSAPDSGAVTYTTSSGLSINNAALGELTFTLPHTATIAQTPGTYWWRLDLTDASSNVVTALYGNLYVLAV